MTKTDSFYTLLDHTADLGIRVWGADLQNLFKNAGKALMQILISGESLQTPHAKKITLSGDDLADLMVLWLGEILYLLVGDELVVTSFPIVDVKSSRLNAVVETIPFDPEFHEILNEIKAVTYHQIQVVQKGTRWEAQVIFDL